MGCKQWISNTGRCVNEAWQMNTTRQGGGEGEGWRGQRARRLHCKEQAAAEDHLSPSANKSTEDILVRRKPKHISMDVLPACLLVVVQHYKHSPA